MMDLLQLARFGLLLGCGLLVPGWLLGRALRTPGGPAGALLGSAALLTQLFILLDALGVRLDAPHMALALAGLCGLLAWIAARRAPAPTTGTGGITRHWPAFSWLMIPAGLGLLAILVRAGVDPLSGWDCSFRWDFLAREIVRTGSLDFYPPITADDFQHYAWCDGIAPLVSGLYAWSYFCLGRIDPGATIPVVAAQGVLLFYLVGRLAASRSGATGAAMACALLATSAALLWAVAMGQETGLTALSIVAMFWFIEQGRARGETGWFVWAGIAAGTGGLAREYGLCFFVLGWLALFWWRQPRRQHLAFLGACALVAAPWYLRNWAKTGNPLYSLELGSLFPVNPVLTEYLHLVARDFSLSGNLSFFRPLLPDIAQLAGIPLLVGVIGGVLHRRTSGPWLAALFVLVGLWLWSVGLTSGGGIYALRVLAPALALGAVLGGSWLARGVSLRYGWVMVVVLGGWAIQAGIVSLYLPVNPRPIWWKDSPKSWHLFREMELKWNDHPQWEAITATAAGRKILVNDPVFHALLSRRGAHAVPIFSPEVRFLFGANSRFSADVQRLRTAGFRFVLINRGSGFNDAQMAAHPFFPELAATTPVLTKRLFFLYDLDSISRPRGP